MTIVYNLSIYLFQFAVRLASPFNLKARQWIKGREKIFTRIASQIKHDKPLVWVHCASLGEFEQGRPLIEGIKKEHPQYRVLLTFFSPSGYEIRKNYDLADYIFYLPADTPANARRFIELVKPGKVFFVKYEFWYNYFNVLHQKNIPLYLVSAIFRKEQLFFKKSLTGKWYKMILQNVTHFFVQTDDSKQLLHSIGIQNVTRAGDTRFDRVAAIAAAGKQLSVIEQFKASSKLVVVGSSWKPDEELIIQYINSHDGCRFIFAPHEIKPANISRIQSSISKPSICYSETGTKDMNKYEVLLIDSIGLLSSVYRYADLAYIGGGFGVGIHNTLEAVIYNIPVVFGPNYLKFNEAVSLVEKQVAYPICNYQELEKTFDKLIYDDDLRGLISKSCQDYTQSNLGATQTIIEKVFNNQ